MAILPRFYVYILCRPNGKPFYVGKGSGKRIFKHDVEARSGCDCHKCRVIRKIWRQGGEIVRYTVFTTDDEDAAYAYESELIVLHGRGNLTNGTDGGIGGRGTTTSLEVRALRSELRKANWADPAYRERMTAMSQALYADPNMRIKLSEMNKARLADPFERERMSKAQLKRYEDPAERAKQSAVNHIRWADPAQRERLAERNRTPEMRAKLSATRKAQWADPEYRAKMLAANQRRKQKL
jgi:LEM3-like protein